MSSASIETVDFAFALEQVNNTNPSDSNRHQSLGHETIIILRRRNRVTILFDDDDDYFEIVFAHFSRIRIHVMWVTTVKPKAKCGRKPQVVFHGRMTQVSTLRCHFVHLSKENAMAIPMQYQSVQTDPNGMELGDKKMLLFSLEMFSSQPSQTLQMEWQCS